ncbi:GIN domain-containing protein [Maribacter sp. CXY002]|uniref:GIN domain-containing protein n=1 Tax=Maribacter luteocoastalis TaxID=3407671 RepID=UPI003B679654
MNRQLVILFLILVGFQSFGQRKPKIKGNRNVVEVREDLPPFSAIELEDDLEVVLQKSSNEGYMVEADDNLLDVLKFKVADSTLIISSFYNITTKKRLNITIYYTELDRLSMNNGEISMNDVITSDKLDIQTSGTARLELNATASIINIEMEGISSGDFNVASDSLNLTLKDRIDVKVYATGESNTIYMYKNASAKLEGNVERVMAKLYGNSNLKAEKLETNATVLVSEDSPSAYVFVTTDFQLSSRGSSKTSLYGNPKITILDFLDTSQLHKEN